MLCVGRSLNIGSCVLAATAVTNDDLYFQTVGNCDIGDDNCLDLQKTKDQGNGAVDERRA